MFKGALRDFSAILLFYFFTLNEPISTIKRVCQVSVASKLWFYSEKELCVLQSPILYCMYFCRKPIISYIFGHILTLVQYFFIIFHTHHQKNTAVKLIPKSQNSIFLSWCMCRRLRQSLNAPLINEPTLEKIVLQVWF